MASGSSRLRCPVADHRQADGVQAGHRCIKDLAAAQTKVIAGVRFNHGIEVTQVPANHAA
jgi:hypothetical protein